MGKRTLTDNQVMLRDLSVLLVGPLALMIALLVWWRPWVTYEVPAGTDIYGVAAGTWDWAGADSFCLRDPHSIAFSSDHRVMVLTQRLPWTDSSGVEHRVAEYDIQEFSRRHVRGRIRGEIRRTEAGEPVVWDLVLTSRDEYRWHRTDWPTGSYTKRVRRCAATHAMDH